MNLFKNKNFKLIKLAHGQKKNSILEFLIKKTFVKLDFFQKIYLLFISQLYHILNRNHVLMLY